MTSARDAENFLGLDGAIVPSARWECDNLVIFEANLKDGAIFEPIDFEEIDWRRWAKPTEKDVLQAVMQWKQRRRPPLDNLTVASTIRNLGMLRWLNVKASPDLPLPEEESLVA